MYAKKAMNEKIQAAGENSSNFTNEQSPQGRAFSGDLLDQKVKVPAIPRAWVGGGHGYK